MQFYVVKSVLRPERIFTTIYNMLIRSSSFRGDRAYWNVRGSGSLKPCTYPWGWDSQTKHIRLLNFPRMSYWACCTDSRRNIEPFFNKDERCINKPRKIARVIIFPNQRVQQFPHLPWDGSEPQNFVLSPYFPHTPCPATFTLVKYPIAVKFKINLTEQRRYWVKEYVLKLQIPF